MYGIEKIAEILYQAYEAKYREKRVEIEGLEESFQKLCGMLNHEQKNALMDYDDLDTEFLIKSQKEVIQYILELLCPED